MKRIVLLGATGSIGLSACDVVRTHSEAFRIVALAARSSQKQAERRGREFNAKVYCGGDAAVRAVEETEADLVLVATVGLSGLAPTLSALRKGMDVALATKEVMVAAGALVLSCARASGARLLPVDREHSAKALRQISYLNSVHSFVLCVPYLLFAACFFVFSVRGLGSGVGGGNDKRLFA